VNAQTETIDLVGTSTSELEGLPQAISSDGTRYSLFRYEHTFAGETQSPIIFISSCPSGLKVKDRMLHASSRTFFLKNLAEQTGIEVDKKVSLNSHQNKRLIKSSSRLEIPPSSLRRAFTMSYTQRPNKSRVSHDPSDQDGSERMIGIDRAVYSYTSAQKEICSYNKSYPIEVNQRVAVWKPRSISGQQDPRLQTCHDSISAVRGRG